MNIHQLEGVTEYAEQLRTAPRELQLLHRDLLVPSIPLGSGPFLLGVMGGVGGSVTLLSYSYWIRERGWTTPDDHRAARLDLGAAYLLTGIFGVAVIITAAGVDVDAVTGNEMALAIATQIGSAVDTPPLEAALQRGGDVGLCHLRLGPCVSPEPAPVRARLPQRGDLVIRFTMLGASLIVGMTVYMAIAARQFMDGRWSTALIAGGVYLATTMASSWISAGIGLALAAFVSGG